MNDTLRRSYWQATALLLAAHLAGWSVGLPAVLALLVVMVGHFLAWHRSCRALEVQVRLLYLGLLALGAALPHGAWLHALQLAGLAVRLATDYCLAARLLVLMPWNRVEPFSGALLRRALLSPTLRDVTRLARTAP